MLSPTQTSWQQQNKSQEGGGAVLHAKKKKNDGVGTNPENWGVPLPSLFPFALLEYKYSQLLIFAVIFW